MLAVRHLLIVALIAWAGPVLAQPRTPLLIEGKTTLYQRVLTRPGVKIAEGVGAPGTIAVQPFTPLYVYERMPVDGGGPTYLEVGADSKGRVLGFLKEDETIQWEHSLVLAFAERANRDRTLFFEQQAGLDEWLGSADLLVKADAARRDIDAGKLPDTSPIISIEPEAYVDFESNFYMLPILEAKSKRLPTGFRVREVKIASVTREEAKPVTEQPLRRRVNPDALNNFRAGVVFVIDASSSMQPYIARTRWVMEDVLKRVEAAGLADRVRFGLVGYRDDPAKVPDIEYLTRTFADPNKIKGADDFKLAVEPLAASKVSTREFAEDGFAGIDAAFKTIDWSGFDARSIILITDASSREGNSKLSTTGLNTAEVRAAGAGQQGGPLHALSEDAGRQGRPCQGRGAIPGAQPLPGCRLALLPGRGGRPGEVRVGGGAADRTRWWRRSPRRRRSWPRPTSRHRSRPSPPSRRSRRAPPWSAGRWRWPISAGPRTSRRRRCSRPGRPIATSPIPTSRRSRSACC